jgi:hypothetical protein
MAKWTFFGRVYPERIPLTFPPLSGRGKLEDLGIDFLFRVFLHNSQAVVDLEITRGEPGIDDLKNLAADRVRSLTDIVGYSAGYYFDVEITSARSLDTDACFVFGIEIPVLAQRRSVRTDQWFQASLPAELLQAIGASTHAQMILGDFRDAMRTPTGTGFFCYRAIEAMMQCIRQEGEQEKPAWQRLRTALNVDRSAFDTVKAHADTARHGRPTSITDAERALVLSTTDEVIKRFLAYLLASKQQLLESEFPIFAVPQ